MHVGAFFFLSFHLTTNPHTLNLLFILFSIRLELYFPNRFFDCQNWIWLWFQNKKNVNNSGFSRIRCTAKYRPYSQQQKSRGPRVTTYNNIYFVVYSWINFFYFIFIFFQFFKFFQKKSPKPSALNPKCFNAKLGSESKNHSAVVIKRKEIIKTIRSLMTANSVNMAQW